MHACMHACMMQGLCHEADAAAGKEETSTRSFLPWLSVRKSARALFGRAKPSQDKAAQEDGDGHGEREASEPVLGPHKQKQTRRGLQRSSSMQNLTQSGLHRLGASAGEPSPSTAPGGGKLPPEQGERGKDPAVSRGPVLDRVRCGAGGRASVVEQRMENKGFGGVNSLKKSGSFNNLSQIPRDSDRLSSAISVRIDAYARTRGHARARARTHTCMHQHAFGNVMSARSS